MPLNPLALALVLLFASSRQFHAQPPPVQSPGIPLSSTDWRRAWTGEWVVQFTFDSVRGRDGNVTAWHPASGRTRTGTLTISDTLVGRGHHELSAYLAFDFRSLLGRPMSCFPTFPSTIELSRSGDSVEISFTPTAADCGVGGEVIRNADSATGTWSQLSLAGSVAMGRLQLVRKMTRAP